MLVITRKPNQGFKIGDNIEITVIEVSKDRVKLGISAPKDISVVRNELIETQQLNFESSKAISKVNIEQLLNLNGQGEDENGNR
ncbi:MAG: carbon storage regulator CsrA [Clostridiales bacterium]|nr:carbon storage regulator CsrA [Clostridiales bacterium]